MTDEWLIPAIIFLVLGIASVGAGRVSGWHAHIQNNPHGDVLGYALGCFLWLASVVSAAYLGAYFNTI